MQTSILHINTSFLPLYFGGAAIIFHNAGRIFKRKSLKYLGYRLFMLNGLVTTFTCALGGASIRGVEELQNIEIAIVKLHAWTAMAVFLISVAMAYFSYKANLVEIEGNTKKLDNFLLISSFIFLVFFIYTIMVAFNIR